MLCELWTLPNIWVGSGYGSVRYQFIKSDPDRPTLRYAALEMENTIKNWKKWGLCRDLGSSVADPGCRLGSPISIFQSRNRIFPSRIPDLDWIDKEWQRILSQIGFEVKKALDPRSTTLLVRYRNFCLPDGEDGSGRRELLKEHGLGYIRGQVTHIPTGHRVSEGW